MARRIQAVEIVRQSEQGVSVQPFLVRADDDRLYFVKGLNRAGGASLVSEALCAELGRRLGLPIPDWCIMEISEKLIGFSAIPNVQDLGGGPAFASLQIENAGELMWSNVLGVDVDLQRRILLFDWWIQNGDRALDEAGGNVNLMTDSQGNLVVIDHNAAFEASLTAEEFRKYHVFRDQLSHFTDCIVRLEYQRLLDETLQHWDTICALLPNEWLYRDQDEIDETEPTLEQRLKVLRLYNEERFWGQL